MCLGLGLILRLVGVYVIFDFREVIVDFWIFWRMGGRGVRLRGGLVGNYFW